MMRRALGEKAVWTVCVLVERRKRGREVFR